MKESRDKLARKLKLIFVGTTLLSVTLFVLTALYTAKYVIATENIILERYAIIITLIGVPLSLKIFHDRMKKADKTNSKDYLKKYQNYYLIRLIFIEIIYLFNIISLYLTGSRNFYFMVIVTIFAMLLCAPQISHLEENDDDNIQIDEENP